MKEDRGVMRAARWHGPLDVRVEDVPVPEPAPHQALVEVEWCGICGTDLDEYLHGPVNIPTGSVHPLTGRRAPLALGHEIVGRIAEPARDGSGPPAGTLVVPDVVLGCGNCWWCQRHEEGLCERGAVIGLHSDGGLAGYVAATASTCVPVPEWLSAEVAALAEPTAVAVRALNKAPRLLGSSVLVVGSGTIGLLVIQVARASGARTVVAVDPKPARRELALMLGADYATPPEDLGNVLADATAGIGPGVVVECSGAPGLSREAVRLSRRGGTTILVGFHGGDESLDLLNAVLGEKRIVGSAAHLWDEDVQTAVNLLARGDVDGRPLLTNRVSLERVVEEGFAALEDPDDSVLKVLVTPRSGLPS